MKVLCYVIALIMYVTKFVTSHHLNVGTVLFAKEDLNKKCWTNTDKMLLTARRVMQGVLPDPDFLDFTKREIITVLLDYIESCFELVHQSANEGTQQIMHLALSDAFGGYLRSYILPPTKQAFYAGQIKYKEAYRIFDLYDDIKEYLKTSGNGWSEPRKCNLKARIKPLKITSNGCNTACAKLYFIEKCGKCDANGIENEKKKLQSIKNPTENLVKLSAQLLKSGVNNRLTESGEMIRNDEKKSPFKDLFHEETSGPHLIANLEKNGFWKKKNNRRNANFFEDELPLTTNSKHKSSVNCSNSCFCSSTNEKSEISNGIEQNQHSCFDKEFIKGSINIKRVIIPLPVLDNAERPQVIGFPFKENPLRNLMSRDSICILVRFYLTVIKCLVAKKVNKHDILCFNKQFLSWLESHVLPLLDDEEWYPAFGGVLRIEETIKSIGSGENENCDSSNDISFMFSEGVGFDESQAEEYENNGTEENILKHVSPVYLKFGILSIIITWILAFCYCLLCSCSTKKCNEGGKDADKTSKVDPSNSFILQCFLRFFRKNCADDEKKNEKSQCEDKKFFDKEMRIEMAECPAEAQKKSKTSEITSSKSGLFRNEMKSSYNNKKIVMSAHIKGGNSPNKQPKDWKTCWPFVKFAEDFPVMKSHTEICTKSILQEHLPESSTNKTEFETLWKKQRFNVQTSESHTENCNEQDVTRRMKDQEINIHKLRCQRKFSSSSSFSNNKGFQEDCRKKVLFVKRSPSGHDYRSGNRYSYSTSANSLTTSQVEDELPDELCGRMSDFRKTSDQNSTTEFNQDSESPMETERDLTSSSESGHYSISKQTS